MTNTHTQTDDFYIYMTQSILLETMTNLRSFRGNWWQPHEGVVYWAGIRTLKRLAVLSVIIPAAETNPGGFTVSVSANKKAVNTAEAQRLEIVAQVHSHPMGASTRHSPGDNRDAFQPSEGSFSIIVPDYARGPAQVTLWGFHIFRRGCYLALKSEWASTNVIVLPNLVDTRR